MSLILPQRGRLAGGASGLFYVGGNSDSGTDPWSVSLTALTGGLSSSAEEGDIVIVLVALGDESDVNISISTSGYTELADLYQIDNQDTNLGVFYKIMGATPDTSVSVTTGAQGVVIVQVWRGVDQGTPIDVTTTTAGSQNSNQINPPSITPVTPGAIVIAAGASGTTGSVSSASGSVEFVAVFNDNSAIAAALASYAPWTSGAVDPATFTMSDSTSSSWSWAAATLALRPA